jgi:tetratricopeptide (TPR) repeat protein
MHVPNIMVVLALATMLNFPLLTFTQPTPEELTFRDQDLFAMLDDQTKEFYNEAMAALGRGERILAVMKMEKALARIGPDDERHLIVLKGMVNCYQQVALYYYNYNSKTEAIYYLNKAVSLLEKGKDISLQDKLDECYAYLGKVYYEKGDKKKAFSYLNILKKRNTNSSWYWADELEKSIMVKKSEK